MQAPDITQEDVDAVHHALTAAKQLQQHAAAHPRGALDAQRLEHTVAVLDGLHSTLSMIYLYQKQHKTQAEHQTLDQWEEQ